MLGRKGIDLLKYGKDTDIPEAHAGFGKPLNFPEIKHIRIISKRTLKS